MDEIFVLLINLCGRLLFEDRDDDSGYAMTMGYANRLTENQVVQDCFMPLDVES